MSARPDGAVADVHTEALFEGVNDGSWHATAFETTPPVSLVRSKEQYLLTTIQMSTYLLAFANGEFVHLESSYKSPLSGRVRPLRIYGGLLTLSARDGVDDYLSLATSDVINQAQYALDIKEKALPLYEQAFGIEYPLPKLDTLVANDFDAGAMENWVNPRLF